MGSLGQLSKKLAAARAWCQDRIITHPIGDETGWTTARSPSEVGTTSVHSKQVFACNDCTFLDEIHRAVLEKKSLPAFGAGRVAYPAEYQNSGVMTFLVSHQGKVYEKDLGPDTARIAGSMTAFNPDSTWQQVSEPEASGIGVQ